jgi:eukaryotic-like serine/threonine-protein kinase
MLLAAGTKIGSYEILSVLGTGGMGQVYRARDAKLGREVALKALPDQLANDADRLARFQREAQVLASLNHPHIAQIYGFEDSSGTHALVMELVEGETLAQLLAGAALQLARAVLIASQIADALEAAHEKGIIHRDLKPANVMVTHGGAVKVLDFGLAAFPQAAGPSGIDATHSPTLTLAATRAGVILGTAGYMSPEQAAAKAVDKRADIWSFGVILWEMLTGRRLFEGETISHTLADVLRADVDFGQLPRETPAAIRDLLRRCLDRDAKRRLRDIGEARLTLEKYLTNPAGDASASVETARRLNPSLRLTAIAIGVVAVAVGAAAALAFVHFRDRPTAADPARFQILPPEQTAFATTAVLSPDGRRIAFDAPGPDGRRVLWIRALDSLDSRALAGTEGVSPGPIWSPDGRYLAFGVNGFPSRLKKVAASGGPPQTLCEYTGGYREGAWNLDGTIVFGAAPGGLWQVPEGGGSATVVTALDVPRQEVQHAGPVFLPDGRRFLYHRASRAPEYRGIYMGSLDTKPTEQSTTRVVAADSDPVYVPSSSGGSGVLLFMREGTLFAQSFDGESRLTGDAAPIAQNVGNTGSYGWFSATGTSLAFRTGRDLAATIELVWMDRQGKRIGQLGPPFDSSLNTVGIVQLSSDSKKVAVTRAEGGTSGVVGTAQISHVWTAELARGIFSRLLPGEGNESAPAISPSGRIAFSTTLDGAVGDLYWASADGVGSPEPLLVKSPTVKHPNHFSPDGRFLLYDDHTAQRQDLWILPIESLPPGGERKPIPFLVTQADETVGQFSPDGKWIAYSSDESGRREVYVQGFAPDRVPAVAVGKWQISTAGGDKPRWRRDGRELYYIAPDRKMMAVPVKTNPVFEPGVAIPLFETRLVGFMPYDVSADGRFLLNSVSDTAPAPSSPVTIVLNWQTELKRHN